MSRAIIAEAHASGMEVLAHLSRTSALADAKALLGAGVDGFVHMVRDTDVDGEYLAAVKAHPKVWTGPNIEWHPPNELFELHCRNLRKIHDVGMAIGMGTVLNANPVDDITNTRRISAVYLRGRELDRQALKARFVAGTAKK